MIHITINKAVPEIRGRERLTAGMCGIVRCEFHFSEEWNGLARFAEFTDGTATRSVEITDGVCCVPPEVLTTEGRSVMVGVYGTDGKEVVLPSVFVCLGEVERGTCGSDLTPALTPSLIEQFTARAETVKEAAEGVEEAAASVKEAAEVVQRCFGENTGAVMRRNLYRGAYLGNKVTEEQLAAIRDGSFRHFFIGDYWIIGGITYRIADMDYWYGTGHPNTLTRHHLVLVTDKNLYKMKMAEEDSTAGGYWGSYMKQSGLSSMQIRVQVGFGSALCPHYEYFTSEVEDGRPVNALWRETTVDLMSEIMVYGTNIFSVMNSGGTMLWNYTTARWQLALFRLDPTRITIPGEKSWLRDVVDPKRFAAIGSNGYSYCMKASFENGVRPVFAIG